MKKEYWIIDSDAIDRQTNTCHATGPYPTREAAEAFALKDICDVWNDSCTCLQTEESTGWCAPLLIVEVVRSVIPKITTNTTTNTTAKITTEIELIDA